MVCRVSDSRMASASSLIPELEAVIQHGSQDKRAATVKRIANLFVDGAAIQRRPYRPVRRRLCRLVVEIESQGARRNGEPLAPIANAPSEICVRQLAHDDDIAVAGPVLTQSPRLAEPNWSKWPAPRARRICGHRRRARTSARRSPTCWSAAATPRSCATSPTTSPPSCRRAASPRWSSARKATAILAEKVGQRPDIPPHLFRDLLVRATAVVQQRLLQAAKPETRREIQRVLDKVSEEVDDSAPAARLRRRPARGARRCTRPAGSARPSCRIRQGQEVRGDGGGAVAAQRRADRDRGPADGRRPARSDADPVQGRRLRLDHGAGDHHGRGRAPRAPRRRRSTLPSPISRSCRRRPRNAWCGSGRCARTATPRMSRSDSSAPSENQIARHAAFALGLGLVARAGNPATAAASRRPARPSRQNPASAASRAASRRRNRQCRWRSEIRRPAATIRAIAATLSSCTKRRFQCRRFGHGSG